MTHFFAFDECTYPEVATLPRHCPLVIPLGTGYDWARVAEALGHPPKIGRLPPIPYGWRGSGLEVSGAYLGALLANLLDSLREDGFRQVYALAPQELELGLGAQCLRQFHPSMVAPQPELPPPEARGKVVLIPVGHTEQHGHHLPLNTDTLIIEAIAQGAAATVPQQAVCLPVFPYGVSTHRQAFAGTLNCGGRPFEDFFIALIEALVARGFDRFYFLNGHGGNHSYLVNIVKACGERWRRAFTATSFLYLSGSRGVEALQQHRTSPLGGMGHACELETSLLQHLRPDLVHQERAIDETDFIATPNYYMDWVEGGALIANPPWDDDTRSGAYGAPSHATAEKGRLWLEAAIAEKVEHIAEIHEQQARREARRQSGYGLWGRGRPEAYAKE